MLNPIMFGALHIRDTKVGTTLKNNQTNETFIVEKREYIETFPPTMKLNGKSYGIDGQDETGEYKIIPTLDKVDA